MYDLTIIIPHYNTPLYLKELLLTIPVRENVQVIVIDDKSDKHLEEYNAVKDAPEFGHVTFLDNKTDKKYAGTCRNIGLQHAQGRWLLFADADDFFVEGFYDVVEKYFGSGYDVVFFTPVSADRDTMQPAARHLEVERKVLAYHNSQTKINELRLRYEIDSPWSKLISRELIKKSSIRFNEVIAANDAAFSARVGYYMQSFVAAKDVIYCYTNNAGTLTKAVGEDIFDARINEFIWKYDFIRARIDKRDFRILGLYCAEYLYKVLKYGFGFKKLINVWNQFRKNKIRIISARMFNINELRIKCAASKSSRRFVAMQDL